MIPKITVLVIFLGLSRHQAVYGAAYSKVYVQSGPDVTPVEYLNYGAPPIVTNPQIAQLSAPPVGSVLPLPNIIAPCVSPCFLPGQTVGSVTAVQPSAKYVTYNSPSAPAVAVPTKDDKTSYEYSYVVYDEITGDRKAQRELSDGSVVQGEYSLIQPDGYVREVKYTADDLTGFNAVVKNFLPETFGRENKPVAKTDAAQPCQDIKKEAIKVEPEVETLSPTTTDDTQYTYSTEPTYELVHDHVHNHSQDHPYAHASGHEHDYDYELEGYHHDHSQGNELAVVPALEVSRVPAVVSTALPEPTRPVLDKKEPAAELIKPLTDSNTSKIKSAEVSKTSEPLKTPVAQEAPKVDTSTPVGFLSYSDIIKCVQKALANNSNVPKPNISPLTYVILPGVNKLC